MVRLGGRLLSIVLSQGCDLPDGLEAALGAKGQPRAVLQGQHEEGSFLGVRNGDDAQYVVGPPSHHHCGVAIHLGGDGGRRDADVGDELRELSAPLGERQLTVRVQ